MLAWFDEVGIELGEVDIGASLVGISSAEEARGVAGSVLRWIRGARACGCTHQEVPQLMEVESHAGGHHNDGSSKLRRRRFWVQVDLTGDAINHQIDVRVT